MTTAFENREKAFEAKFRLDQEQEFKAVIRRDKLLGLWAAEQMGLSGDAAKSYALSVVDVEFSATDHDAGHKVARDLLDAGIAMDETAIRHQMAVLLEVAREQIVAEMKQS
ncbi:DUF1476 domain-containing protein [Paramagnetospirillum magneticum]|uniref:Uncharacterized conserved protein n=1 Tax=Paramagnetospirillum magneticum (strain ATCC 700264 / AMB-1) TaxID=342108 RepID=Q2W735_PARM1|nr:DUF1476 domain-containing protein [Paramagnetospirillum magneticum]BAE50340.1 Uncharacterized conserved protein [Paramagnetospirillum magneticum AMB-1]